MAGSTDEAGGWLRVHRVGEGAWRISDNGQDNMYLLTGKEKALLIDTGWGLGGLRDLLGSMTSLPLVVVNTHGHCDHALGNDQFDHVLLGAYDADRLSARDLETKREFVRLGEPLSRARSMPSFDRWGCPARMGCGIVEDEMPIELGSRTVRAYLTPGHTVGSVCYVDEGSRTLFAGDSYVPLASWGPMWLHLDESASLSRFHDAMSRLLGVGGFDSILSGHGECGPLPATRLEGLLSGIRSVVRGEVEGVPVKTIAGEGLRCDWADTGIIYKERSE